MDWYVKYPNGKESKLVSYTEATLLAETYGGGIHREWNHKPEPRKPLSLMPLVKLFAL